MHQSPLTRRELLKILAAAGGAAALSSVPNEWKTPVVEIGALPAHAQGSSFGRIMGTITMTVTGPRASSATALAAQVQVNGSPPVPVVTVLGTSLSANGVGDIQLGFAYTINNVPPGTYTVNCTYECNDDDTPGVVVRGGQTTTVNFSVHGC